MSYPGAGCAVVPVDGDELRGTLLAGLVLAGAIAGVLVATAVTAGPLETVATLEPGHSGYALELSTGTLRLTLVDNADAQPRPAELALYDPDDRFAALLTLSEPGQPAEHTIQRPGSWVLLPTAPLPAPIEIATDSEAGALEPLEVHERVRTLARGNGEPMETFAQYEITPRPALVTLTLDGSVDALDTELRTTAGTPVGTTNLTTTSTLERGLSPEVLALDPGALVAGTYELEARADSLDGALLIVSQRYERSQDTVDLSGLPDPGDPPDEQGTVVGQLDEGQALEIDPQGAPAIHLALPAGDRARVVVFGSSHEAIAAFELGEPETRWAWESPTDNETWAGARIPVEEPGPYVVYVRDHVGEGEGVTVVLPTLHHADHGTPLAITERTVHLAPTPSSPTATWTAELDGGLVAVAVRSTQDANVARSLTIQAPRGTVFTYSEDASAFGVRSSADAQLEPQLLSSGPLHITLRSELATGPTELVLRSYHP